MHIQIYSCTGGSRGSQHGAQCDDLQQSWHVWRAFAEFLRAVFNSALSFRPGGCAIMYLITLQKTTNPAAHCSTLHLTASRCNILCWQSHCFTATHWNTWNTQNKLQHTKSRCNTLQHTATCSSDNVIASLQHTSAHCNVLQRTATHCNALQHTATPCNTLQHTATRCADNTIASNTFSTVLRRRIRYLIFQCVALSAACCSVLQCVTVRCSVLQCDAFVADVWSRRSLSADPPCVLGRGGGLGSRPTKMYGERLGDGVEYHLMKPTPRR